MISMIIMIIIPLMIIERHAVDGQASATNGMIKLANEVYAQTTVSIGQPDFALDEVKNA